MPSHTKVAFLGALAPVARLASSIPGEQREIEVRTGIRFLHYESVSACPIYSICWPFAFYHEAEIGNLSLTLK